MRKYSLLLLIVVLLLPSAYGQNSNVNLLLQSPDGKNVKLIWFVNSWRNDFTGFDIKRKEGLRNWVTLNAEPIMPEISTKKNLSNVESDKLQEGEIKARMFKLIMTRKLKEVDHATLLQQLNSGDNTLEELTAQITRNYDLALFTGFGYVDHSATVKTNYQYGLFIAGTNTLLAKADWSYGQIPDLDAVMDITSKATTNANGIRLSWNADLNKIRAADIAGFNIYREGIRLNSLPVLALNTKNVSAYEWYDKNASSTVSTLYSISAESIFGIEGIIKSYTYNPEDHPTEYMRAEVTDIASLGYYFKEGISVKWNFPKEYERFIKGFYLEKDNMPDGYKTVSALLDPSTRQFVDRTASPVSNYLRMRVMAVYNDKTSIGGLEKLYSYFPIKEPPPPLNVKGTGVFRDNKFTIQLSWDKPLQGDSITDHYMIYPYDKLNARLNLKEKMTSRTNNFTIVVDHGAATVNKYCVTSVSASKVESAVSDTLSVTVPSMQLLTPQILKCNPDDSSRVQIQWQFDDVADLKGFRLFQNKAMIADETEISNTEREFTTKMLEQKAIYEFTIRAITTNGVLSDYSAPIMVTMPKLKKK